MLTHSNTIGALALAVASAQVKYLTLGKDKSANIASRSGASYSYDYADLADTFDAIRDALAAAHLAVMQPVSMDGEHVIVTTMLVHGDSGEWMRDELAMPVSDPRDPRAIGSAVTYAKRYALQSMVGIAPRGEDDDAETARGGSHEMSSSSYVSVVDKAALAPEPKTAKLCPICGVDAILKSKYGGWFCFDKKGGCKARWPEGPHPADLPKEPVSQGTVSLEQAAREADTLFAIGDVLTADEAERLVLRVQERFEKIGMSKVMQRKLWAEHVGPSIEFESARGASLDGLWALLNALGVKQ